MLSMLVMQVLLEVGTGTLPQFKQNDLPRKILASNS